MKVRLLASVFVLFSALILGFSRDDDPVMKLIASLEKFRSDFPQEKAYLHVDKPYYSVGDTIWFSAYLVDAENNLASAKSNVLYADLIDEQGRTRRSLRLPLAEGRGAGDFVLTDSLREGWYRIRSYSNWMRNFGEEFFYDHTFFVGNALTNQVLTSTTFSFSKIGSRENVTAKVTYTDFSGTPLAEKPVSYEVELNSRNIAKGSGVTDAQGVLSLNFTNGQAFNLRDGHISTHIKLDEKNTVTKLVPVKSTAQSTDLQFFPEGGQLVDSLRSKVAFKLTGTDGMGIDATGYVADDTGARIAELTTSHAGMGAFALLPYPGRVYTAHVKLPDGSEKTANLPGALSAGYVLDINPFDGDSVRVTVSLSRSLAGKGGITLVAQSHHVTAYVAKSSLTTRQFTAKVARSRFPAGIAQFTLFNDTGKPLAERVCFIRGKQANVTVSTDLVSYVPRQRVKMDLAFADASGNPVAGSFSTSVTDFTRVPSDENNESTIQSELLLGSDLRGYIEKPNYYFTTPGPDKDNKLDLLMLTQGWRRFAWQELASGVFPSLPFPAENGVSISGRVFDNDHRPVSRAKVLLMSTSGTAMVLDTLTDSEGTFRFENLVFAEQTQIVVQARTEKGKKNVNIELDLVSQQFQGKNENSADILLSVPPAQLAYLKDKRKEFDELRMSGLLKRTIVLNEVKLAAKKTGAEIAKNSANLNGAGNADAVIEGEKLANAPSLSFALAGRVAGLTFRNGIPYLVRNLTASFTGPVPMQVVLDGMPLGGGALDMISPNDVQSVEVLKSIGNTAIYGIQGAGGVLVITTKRGQRNLDSAVYAPGIATFSPMGYYPSRQFYSPKYESPDTPKVPDLRSTVYWNPFVQARADGKASVEFYTAGNPGRYRATIEGIAADGTLARKVTYFTVR